MPPWQRTRLPLLYCADELICVPGLMTEYAYQAKSAEQGLLVSWHVQD